MSLHNPLVSLYAIDLNEAKELVDRLSIRSVPTFSMGKDILVLPVNEWILAQVMRRYGSSDTDDL
ncbi:MAG: hypothetical protein M1596_01850 [Firmicutes bacterium]|nr:hypothetical protein [Bacillota bacterium]